MALYRKYRSRSLDEIVGQEHVTDILKRAIQAGRISHAYLLTGPRGVGKTSIARILAHEINGLPYDGEASHLDIIEIDAASNRRIDDIRDLRDKIHIAPSQAKYKVYIIDEVHMLTGESFNALLKTLEEPPQHAVFILATTEAHKLPATIVSRTQRFAFRPIDEQKAIEHLRFIAAQEHIAISDAALALVAQHGGGSFRDSISLLDQLSASAAGEIGEADVTASLGLASTAALSQLIAAVIKPHPTEIIRIHRQLESEGYSVGSFIGQLITALRAQADSSPELYRLVDSLLDVTKSSYPSLKLLTSLLDYVMPSGSAPAQKPKTMPVSSVPPAVAAASLVASVRKSGKASEPAAKPRTKEVKKPEPAPEPQYSVGAFDLARWPEVLAAVKKANPPLYGVLKHAEAIAGDDKTKLRLVFGYTLHSKKIDDPKYRSQLSAVIAKLCGSCPILVIETAKKKKSPDTEAAITTNAEPEGPSETSSILAIMGGGEVVSNGS